VNHGQLLKSGSCLCLLPKHAVQHLKHPYQTIFTGRKATLTLHVQLLTVPIISRPHSSLSHTPWIFCQFSLTHQLFPVSCGGPIDHAPHNSALIRVLPLRDQEDTSLAVFLPLIDINMTWEATVCISWSVEYLGSLQS